MKPIAEFERDVKKNIAQLGMNLELSERTKEWIHETAKPVIKAPIDWVYANSLLEWRSQAKPFACVSCLRVCAYSKVLPSELDNAQETGKRPVHMLGIG